MTNRWIKKGYCPRRNLEEHARLLGRKKSPIPILLARSMYIYMHICGTYPVIWIYMIISHIIFHIIFHMIYISHHILKKWLVIAPSDDPRWNLNACGWRQWIASSRHPQRAPGVNVCRVSGPNHRSFFESFAILIILYIYIIYLFIIIYSYLLLSTIICYYIILCHIILYYMTFVQVKYQRNVFSPSTGFFL